MDTQGPISTTPHPRASAVERARAAIARQAWADAFAEYTDADREQPLEPADLAELAGAADMLGRADDRDAFFQRAIQAFGAAGNIEGAASCAFWLGFALTMSGEPARGGGWLARAARLLDDAGLDSVVRGYLLLPRGVRTASGGDPLAAHELFAKALEVGRRFDDRTLVAFARNAMGRTLVFSGRVAEGVALLDEAMVAVSAGEVRPNIVGAIYCGVVEVCHSVFDLRRAQEWTDALSRWCESQPDRIPFRGSCLIYRAEMMQLHGDWPRALDEARRACEWLSDPPGQPAAGAAFYRTAELHRVRGAFDEAETAYLAASEAGRQPHPGLALLWLARGRPDTAVAAIRRLLAERQDTRMRVRVLEAAVEIALGVNDTAMARAAASELSELAEQLAAPYLSAAAAHGMGWTLLAEGRADEALDFLRRAADAWRALRAPFEAARTRVLVGLAHRALGDDGTCTLELTAARRALEELGATHELAKVAALAATPTSPAAKRDRSRIDALTKREVDVLTLIASGKTNRAIAAALGISEKTVARHISNIFTKLGLPNRAAATAYAYEHDLLKPAPAARTT